MAEEPLVQLLLLLGAAVAIVAVEADFRSASVPKDGRVVFNIAGNQYRLVVWVTCAYRVVYVRFIGTHAAYDAIDAQTI